MLGTQQTSKISQTLIETKFMPILNDFTQESRRASVSGLDFLEKNQFHIWLMDKFFHAATIGNHQEIQNILSLDDADIDIKFTTDDLRKALCNAAQNGHNLIVDILLKHQGEAISDESTRYDYTQPSFGIVDFMKPFINLTFTCFPSYKAVFYMPATKQVADQDNHFIENDSENTEEKEETTTCRRRNIPPKKNSINYHG